MATKDESTEGLLIPSSSFAQHFGRDDQDLEALQNHRKGFTQTVSGNYTHWIVHFVSTSLILLLLLGSTRSNCVQDGLLRLESRLKSSPPVEAMRYRSVKFNGSIDFRSAWKGPPRSELDALWNSVTHNITYFPISKEDLEQNGRRDFAEETVRFPAETGHGFIAGFEVFHHLHCLNMLRKISHAEYYKDQDILWTDKPHVFRDHVDHCIDMLRQQIMCTADTGLTTYVWVEGYQLPYPDFSTNHQCRDFERIKDWVLENDLPLDVRSYRKPPGVRQLDKPPFP